MCVLMCTFVLANARACVDVYMWVCAREHMCRCRFNAHWNVVTSRMIPLVPAVGEGNCINVNVQGAAVYRAVKYRPELWDEEDASNFAISMWCVCVLIYMHIHTRIYIYICTREHGL